MHVYSDPGHQSEHVGSKLGEVPLNKGKLYVKYHTPADKDLEVLINSIIFQCIVHCIIVHCSLIRRNDVIKSALKNCSLRIITFIKLIV